MITYHILLTQKAKQALEHAKTIRKNTYQTKESLRIYVFLVSFLFFPREKQNNKNKRIPPKICSFVFVFFAFWLKKIPQKIYVFHCFSLFFASFWCFFGLLYFCFSFCQHSVARLAFIITSISNKHRRQKKYQKTKLSI